MTLRPETQPIHRTVRASQAHLFALMSRLDANDGQESGAAGARHRRYPYRQPSIVMHLIQPGSSQPSTYLVPARDLSVSSISVFHGGYIHPGSKCVLQLVTLDGAWACVRGSVTRARYVEGNIHDVGITFDRDIDLSHYCQVHRELHLLIAHDHPEAEPCSLSACLEKLGVETSQVYTRQDLLAQLTVPRDAVFVEMQTASEAGFEAVPEIRAAGYRGAVVAVMEGGSPVLHERCLLAGCDRYLHHPVTHADVFQLLGKLHDYSVDAPAHVQAYPVPEGSELIRDIPSRIRQLEEALLTRQFDQLEAQLAQLHDIARTDRHAAIADAAAHLALALKHRPSVRELHTGLNDLVELCLSARIQGAERFAPQTPLEAGPSPPGTDGVSAGTLGPTGATASA